MKRLIGVTIGLLAFANAAHCAEHGASYGEHGMALFGGPDALYASHLPMFHAPHDYQVLLQVHLADASEDAALRKRLDGKTALWTLSPEPFELDRLAPHSSHPLVRFKADVVLGHFEQGGKTQTAGATIVVDKVLLYRHLSARAKRSASARYLQIGGGTHRYLVKQIDSRPDFDHIVAMTARAGAPTTPVTVVKHGLAEPDRMALAGAAPHGSEVAGTVYFYADDLR